MRPNLGIIGIYISIAIVIVLGLVQIWYDGPIPYSQKIVMTAMVLLLVSLVAKLLEFLDWTKKK